MKFGTCLEFSFWAILGVKGLNNKQILISYRSVVGSVIYAITPAEYSHPKRLTVYFIAGNSQNTGSDI